ncbi:MAG: ATP synthase subunit I [Culicoidibacterales bacterium]
MYEDNFSVEYAKNVMIRIPLVASILAILGFFIFRLNTAVLFGVLLGAVISSVNFWLQVQYVRSVIFAEKPKRFIIGSLIRLGLTAGAFILAMLYPQWLNIFAVFIGVMIAPIIIIGYRRRQTPAAKGGQKKQ